jgi:hypothetical protein
MERENLISRLSIVWEAPRGSGLFIMRGRLTSLELRPLGDPGVFLEKN